MFNKPINFFALLIMAVTQAPTLDLVGIEDAGEIIDQTTSGIVTEESDFIADHMEKIENKPYTVEKKYDDNRGITIWAKDTNSDKKSPNDSEMAFKIHADLNAQKIQFYFGSAFKKDTGNLGPLTASHNQTSPLQNAIYALGDFFVECLRRDSPVGRSDQCKELLKKIYNTLIEAQKLIERHKDDSSVNIEQFKMLVMFVVKAIDISWLKYQHSPDLVLSVFREVDQYMWQDKGKRELLNRLIEVGYKGARYNGMCDSLEQDKFDSWKKLDEARMKELEDKTKVSDV